MGGFAERADHHVGTGSSGLLEADTFRMGFSQVGVE
jgi:hypothetical protein